jgi:hypothetical protein
MTPKLRSIVLLIVLLLGITRLLVAADNTDRGDQDVPTDQKILAEIAIRDPDPKRRYQAIQRLQDQQALSQIARDTKDTLRGYAIERLTDQSVLAEIVLKDPDGRIRLSATSGISDPKHLGSVVSDSKDMDVIIAALQKIENEGTLLDIYGDIRSYDTRRAIAERLLYLQASSGEVPLDGDHRQRAITIRMALMNPTIRKCYGDLKLKYLYSGRFDHVDVKEVTQGKENAARTREFKPFLWLESVRIEIHGTQAPPKSSWDFKFKLRDLLGREIVISPGGPPPEPNFPAKLIAEVDLMTVFRDILEPMDDQSLKEVTESHAEYLSEVAYSILETRRRARSKKGIDTPN